MKRAFVLEPTRHNLTQAAAFGEVTYLYPHGETRPSIFQEEFQRDVVKRLEDRDYDHTKDLIVVAGAMTTLIIALAAIASWGISVELLVYDATAEDYRQITVGDWYDAKRRS